MYTSPSVYCMNNAFQATVCSLTTGVLLLIVKETKWQLDSGFLQCLVLLRSVTLSLSKKRKCFGMLFHYDVAYFEKEKCDK